MTIETLNDLRSRREEIRRLEEKEEELRARAEKITTVLSGMPHSVQDGDRMGNIVAEIIEYADRIAEKRLEFIRKCDVAEQWIDALPEQQRKVMRLYYVDGVKTWEEVARMVPYSKRHCLRIKDAAFSKMSPNVTK